MFLSHGIVIVKLPSNQVTRTPKLVYNTNTVSIAVGAIISLIRLQMFCVNGMSPDNQYYS